LAEEEASLPSKPKPKTGPKKKVPRPAGPDSLASSSKGAVLDDDKPKYEEKEAPVEFGATGIDQMLEALEVVNARSDKDALGSKVSLPPVMHVRRTDSPLYRLASLRSTPRYLSTLWSAVVVTDPL
jgi:hypothetical protein